MKVQHIVQALEEAARQLGVRVRRERGGFRGGRCKVGEEEVIVLNKSHPPEAHLAILAESLRDLPVDTIFVRPAVRKALEDVWSRRTPVDVEVEEDAD
jgi:hypothetical protein